MGESKINVTLGSVSFSGEGDQAWLAEQLDKVLKAAPEVGQAPPVRSGGMSGQRASPAESQHGQPFETTLSAYVREKGGEANQVERFLITADWLRLRGQTSLTSAAVAKALKENHQKRLANPADCLNKNVGKGMCEKADGGFYITPEGLRKLGH